MSGVERGAPATIAGRCMVAAVLAAALGMTEAAAQASRTSQPESVGNPSPPKAVASGRGLSVPVPDTATGLKYDPAIGRLEFGASSSVAQLVAFFRAELPRQAWHELSGTRVRPDEASFAFQKGRSVLSVEINGRSREPVVTILGEDLAVPSPVAGAVPPIQIAPSQPAEQVAADRLTVKDSNGLIYPQPSRSEKLSIGVARHVEVGVPASIADIVAFYRRESAARGWKEEPGGQVSGERARLRFAAPEGPATLTLTRNVTAGLTVTRLRIIRERMAREEGLMPVAGRAVVMFGNDMATAAEFKIQGQTVKVAAGILPGLNAPPSQRPPRLELQPGTHRLTVAVGRQPSREIAVVIDDESPWGVVVTPDSLEVLPVY